MHLEEVHNDILHVSFATNKDLAYTFMRFQEHYENPQFKGRTFTKDEFILWYVGKNDKFDYYEWDGFNVPGHIFNTFYEGNFDPLDEKEQEMLKLLSPYKHRRFYVIGTCASNTSFNHEIAHALFYTFKDYKKNVMEILSSIDKRERQKINKVLLDVGYDKEFFDDETQAYLVGGLDLLKRKGLKDSNLEKQQRDMRTLFRKYKNG